MAFRYVFNLHLLLIFVPVVSLSFSLPVLLAFPFRGVSGVCLSMGSV